ncbi:MAG: LacI family DNA-binding transcriptional regulator [Spirochaetes bacterium]|nr:LacI family DNA-binding transcriptional regulator [Spirochaetota bacterium]
MDKSPSTIKDIARLAGVGTTSVSKYFSGKGYLSEETRARIDAAVKKTDYRINKSASSLKSRSTRELAIVIPEKNTYTSYARDHFMAQKFAAAIEAAFLQKYDLLLVYAPTEPDAFEHIVRTHTFAGVLFLERVPEHFAETLTRFGIPYVFSNFTSLAPGTPEQTDNAVNAAVSDFRGMIADVFQFAVQNGYRTIGFQGFLNRIDDASAFISGLCGSHGIHDVSSVLTEYCTGKTDASSILISDSEEKTLLVIENRSFAMKAHRELFTVPQNTIGLIAMDDFPEFSSVVPEISHLAQDTDRMSKECITLLTGMITRGEMKCSAVYVPVRLVRKGTTALQ